MSVRKPVSRTKTITTVIISICIMLALFGIFVLLFDNNKSQKEGSVTYIIDEVNNCGWESGVITTSTEAFGPLTVETIDAADEEEYLKNAEKEGRCIAKLGDNSGSYGAGLNKQYQNQQE